MEFQEGFDIGVVLFPAMALFGLLFLGLVVWLIISRAKPKKTTDAQPSTQQFSSELKNNPPYILAISRSATGWEIYVEGQRANANTTYDTVTRKQGLEALRELARFARARLQDQAATVGVIDASSAGEPQPRVSSPSVDATLATGTAHPDGSPASSRSTISTDASTLPSTVPVLNLAQEIGEIVDELLADTPSLQHHAVDLINAQTEGINFVVDGVVYKAVEDIPDSEIQALIRKATRVWERR